jgi:hypothetical protein
MSPAEITTIPAAHASKPVVKEEYIEEKAVK